MKKLFIIITIIILILLIWFLLIRYTNPSLPKNNILKGIYIKIICIGQHFSCEQNMSDECSVDGICIN